jgi:branched-chain amino acid transport system substrate-binding protein
MADNAMKKIASVAALTLCAIAIWAGPARAQFKLGLSAPLTGPLAAFGDQAKRGMDQAVEDINRTGGILGQRILLSYGDDAGDPKQGVSVANKFAGDGIRFVIGPFNSSVTMAASNVYLENSILEVTPSATNPMITDRGMWSIVRICGRDDQQGTVAGNYIIEHFKGKRIFIVTDKSTYGQGIANEVKKTINAAGIQEVGYEGINLGDKDFSALVSKIKAAGADLVYWGGVVPEGALLVRQMRDQGVAAPLMGGDGIATEDFAAIAGPAAEGTLMTYEPDPRKRPQAKPVVDELRAKGFEPEAYTLYYYASVQVVAQAIEAARVLDPKRVADQIHSGTSFKTVIGDLSFDKKGDINRLDYVMYVWRKNSERKITYVELEK